MRYSYFQVKCPHCGRMVWLKAPAMGIALRRGKHVLYCPYCGAPLGEYPIDTQIATERLGTLPKSPTTGVAPVSLQQLRPVLLFLGIGALVYFMTKK